MVSALTSYIFFSQPEQPFKQESYTSVFEEILLEILKTYPSYFSKCTLNEEEYPQAPADQAKCTYGEELKITWEEVDSNGNVIQFQKDLARLLFNCEILDGNRNHIYNRSDDNPLLIEELLTFLKGSTKDAHPLWKRAIQVSLCQTALNSQIHLGMILSFIEQTNKSVSVKPNIKLTIIRNKDTDQITALHVLATLIDSLDGEDVFMAQNRFDLMIRDDALCIDNISSSFTSGVGNIARELASELFL